MCQKGKRVKVREQRERMRGKDVIEERQEVKKKKEEEEIDEREKA